MLDEREYRERTDSPEQTRRPVRIFLSYGRRDAADLADRLKQNLLKEGFVIWQDQESLQVGAAWTDEIESEIEQTDVVLALLSPHAVRRSGQPGNPDQRDSVCLNEIEFAVSRMPPKPILPVMAETCEVPISLIRHHHVDMTSWRESADVYRSGLEQIVAGIHRIVRHGADVSWNPNIWNFSAFLEGKRSEFCGRDWLFKEVLSWCEQRGGERALLITGDPGAGKSAIIAELIHRNPDDRVIAYHCCQADSEQTLEPWRFVQNLVAMLATRFRSYANVVRSRSIRDALSESNCRDDPGRAFDAGILAPLREIRPPCGVVCLILIDSLDESIAGRSVGQSIVNLLSTRVDLLPDWIRLVATTRKEQPVLDRLRGLRAKQIDAQDPRNLKDVEDYIQHRCKQRVLAEQLHSTRIRNQTVVAQLRERSEGNFLYVKQALDGIERELYRFDKLDDLPPGLFGIYQAFFERHFPDEDSFRSPRLVLQVIGAAEEPLSFEQIVKATSEPEKNVSHVLRILSGYLPRLPTPDADGVRRFAVFHKSLTDWMNSIGSDGERFEIHLRDGHAALAELGWREYQTQCRNMSTYTLLHLPSHLAAARLWTQLEELLLDFQYLEYKVGRRVDFRVDGRGTLDQQRTGTKVRT